jgi:signal transduction histidine kinase
VGTAKERGTGIGLMLFKEFVEKNGGNIAVTSIVGKGSVFEFSLPKPNCNS